MSDAAFVVLSALLGAGVGWALRPTLIRFDSGVPQRVPIPELATAALFGLAAAEYDDWHVIPMFVLMVSCVALSIIDLRQYRLPNAVLFPGLAASAAVIVVGEIIDGETSHLTHALIGALLYCGILLIMHLISPAGMGFGDVKLALLLGMFVGWVSGSGLDALRAVMIALLIGSAMGVVLGIGRVLILRLGKNFLPDPEEGSAGTGMRHTTFPFGPPLMVGAILVSLYPATFVG